MAQSTRILTERSKAMQENVYQRQRFGKVQSFSDQFRGNRLTGTNSDLVFQCRMDQEADAFDAARFLTSHKKFLLIFGSIYGR